MFHSAHTEDGECDISSPKIAETYSDLVHKKDLTWILLSYTRTNGCVLDVSHTGNNLDNLLPHMKEDAVHFVIVKISAGNSTYGLVEKFILITWVGKRVAPTKRSKASRHKRTVATIIKDGVAVEVHTSSVDDVKETSLLQKLYTARAPSGPAPLSSNRELPKPPPKKDNPTTTTTPTPTSGGGSKPKPKPGPIPAKPLPSNPIQNREKEERERKEKEEKERIERERLEKERKEKEERERLEKAEKQRLEKEKQEKDRQDKLKRDQEAAAAAKPKPQPTNTSPAKPAPITTVKPKPAPSGFNQGGGLGGSLPAKVAAGGGGGGTGGTSSPGKAPSLTITPSTPGEALSLSDDVMLKEMGRLGRKVGVSPHPPRRTASPPATPSPPHHTLKPLPKVLSFGLGSLQGKRPSMEDRHMALLSLPKNPKIAYFGIYDGHAGEEAADFAADCLHSEIDKYLSMAESKYGGDKQKALVQAFITVDENFCDEACNNYWDSGTTAIVALFDTETKKVLAVNVGDSRCVLGRGGKAFPLSEDHKPWVEKEKERILAAGKEIEDNRVGGSHAFSRSIGDREMKDDLLEPHEQAICPIPEFQEITLSSDPTEREFLILACDGLWDVMTNAEAVTWVDKKLEDGVPLETIASELAQHAIDIGSTDNVSILIVELPK